jgi:RNA polymerase sigma factor (TIGR02999 family)
MANESESAGMSGAGEITGLLQQMREGKPEDAEELLSRVYQELRELAARKMSREAPGQTLQPTALVHEVWLRLGIGDGAQFPDRAYFFAAAGEAMRRILVEIARRKKRLKHGGNFERVDIDTVDLAAPGPDDELLAVDEVLHRFAEVYPGPARLVKLLYFVGLTEEQAAKRRRTGTGPMWKSGGARGRKAAFSIVAESCLLCPMPPVRGFASR